jgi:hypothetical protein
MACETPRPNSNRRRTTEKKMRTIEEILAEESQQPKCRWYLSFADEERGPHGETWLDFVAAKLLADKERDREEAEGSAA